MIERNSIFLPLMGFPRNTEGELIFQSLKKIVHGDHLSQKVKKNVKMLDLENNNSTLTYTRAAVVVNTTVVLRW